MENIPISRITLVARVAMRVMVLLFMGLFATPVFCEGESTKTPLLLPFIDLHCHIEGALTIPIIKRLSKIQNIPLPTDKDEDLAKLLTVQNESITHDEFLNYLTFPTKLLQTKKGITEAFSLIAKEKDKDGLLYLELYFTPQLSCEGRLTQEDAVKAALKGIRKSKLKTNLILCCLQGEGVHEKNLETIKIAKKYFAKDNGVAGLSLMGSVDNSSLSDYESELLKAKEYSIPFTIHAVESSDDLKFMLDHDVKRVENCIGSALDDELLGRTKDAGLTFDFSPTSNKVMSLISDMNKYPLKKFLDTGMRFTINTDYPAIFGTTLKSEWGAIQKFYNLTNTEMKSIYENSVDAAFTTDEVKIALKSTINLVFDVLNDDKSE